MDTKEKYVRLFKVLCLIYHKSKTSDLGSFLGSMNPEFLMRSDCQSADPAFYDDFETLVSSSQNQSDYDIAKKFIKTNAFGMEYSLFLEEYPIEEPFEKAFLSVSAEIKPQMM